MESAGLHIHLDAFVADVSVFTREKLEELFTKLVVALDMTALAPPVVYEVDVNPAVQARVKNTGVFEDSGGITSFQVISKSHLSLHAWPLDKFFSLDAFSCCDFDAPMAIAIIKETLGVTKARTRTIARWKPDPDGPAEQGT